MRNSSRLIPSLLLSTFAGLLSATALAQSAPASGPGASGMRAEQRSARQSEHRASMHARLHDTLKLSAAQEPAWKTFTEAMQPSPRVVADRQSLTGLTAPERADKMVELSRQHQATVEKRASALKVFYAQLNSEQQRAFDAFHAAMPMRTGAGMHHPRGGQGGPGHKGMPL